MNIRLFFCAVTACLTGVWVLSAPTDAAIKDACAALAQNAKDAKAQGVIQATAIEDTMPAAMRSRAMVLCALPFLQQMNTNQFGRMVQVLMTTHPKEGPAVLGLTEDDWLATCPVCNGAGAKTVTCPTCSGQGKCPTCKGTRKAPPCTACKGEGLCSRCAGSKEFRTACLECKGTGKVVVLSPNVSRRYEQVLAELRALATENIQFAEQSQKALAVRGNAKERLAALEEVLAAFPGRQDTAPLVRAREAVQSELAEKAAKEQAQEEQNRERKERDALFSAAQNLPHSTIPVLLDQIDAFTAKYPKSEYGIELEVLKSKQQSRHTFYTNLWRVGYVFGGLIAVLFVVSLVKAWIAQRTKKETVLKIPGMENMNADEFTDPLSDSRKAAAEREADDDLGIYP